MDKYFCYDPDNGYETFPTEKAALEFAQDCIDECLQEGWAESVDQIVVGVITHQTVQHNLKYRKDMDEEELEIATRNNWEYTCSYKIEPIEDKESSGDE